MTDLLSRSTSREHPSVPTQSRTGATLGTAGRPAGAAPPWAAFVASLHSPAARAAAAALTAAATGLAALWVVALAGWYSSDGGSHGSSTAALRIGTDAWLLAHGSGLGLRGAEITAVPLGLTLFCGWLCYRSARWVGASGVDDLRGAGHVVAVLAGVYGLAAGGCAVLASVPGAAPGAVRSYVGAALVACVAGTAGVVRGADLRSRVRSWLPVPLRSAAYGGLCTVLVTLLAGAVAVLASLGWHAAAAARVLEQLDGGVSGTLLLTLVSLLLLPNAAGLTSAWLLGPGFAVGSGTVVAPSAVALGPVPAVPLLAALPADGTPSPWFGAVLAVPLLVGGWGAWRAGRRLPTASWVRGALRGLAAGVAGAVGLALAVTLSGGAVGPGRMADVGAPLGEVFLLALAAFTAGGAVGGPAATWWSRRHGVAEAEVLERPAIGPALVEVRGSVHTSAVQWLWSSRPWSRPWQDQYTLGEHLPEDLPVDLSDGLVEDPGAEVTVVVDRSGGTGERR